MILLLLTLNSDVNRSKEVVVRVHESVRDCKSNSERSCGLL